MRRILFALVALALVAGPSGRRLAASPCRAASGMDCCRQMGEEGAPPCHCSLNRIPPAPAAQDAAQASPVALGGAPLPAARVDAPAAADAPIPVEPRARAAPLFLLHSVLLV